MKDLNEHTTEFLKQFQKQQVFAAKKNAGESSVLLVIGVVLCILFPPLILLALIGVVVWQLLKKHGKSAQTKETRKISWTTRLKRKEVPEDDLTFRASSTFTVNEDGEIWMSREKQLEQLNVLRDAGLLEPEEYRMKKERIENGS